jgi:hypothetical protein
MRKLRLIVDATKMVIRTHPLTRQEAEGLVASLRTRVLDLFPGKGAEFDLIYAPRFRRVIEDRFGTGDGGTEPQAPARGGEAS